MTPNDILPYSYISIFLSYHQRSFLLNQGHTTGQCPKRKRFWNTQSKIGCHQQIPPLRAQRAMQKRGQKDCKSLKWWMKGRYSVFQTQQYYHIYEFTEAVVASTELVQVQARWAPNTNRERRQELSSLTKRLHPTDNSLQRKHAKESHWVHKPHLRMNSISRNR